MSNKVTKREQGFTIIEVLFVLAIAGLIMLIVFLAMPALQRNSRNNSRRNDVSRVGSAVSDFMTNNNGKLPASKTGANNDLEKIRNSVGDLSQYEPADIDLTTSTTNSALGSDGDEKKLIIVSGGKCTDNAGTEDGTSRQAAILYAVETSGSPQGVCLNI